MILKVDGISYSYKDRKVFGDITFEVFPGEVVAVLGPNGAGKTTLLKCLDNILTPDSGCVSLGDSKLTDMSRREVAKNIAYVSQRGEAARTRVAETILLGRRPHIGADVTKRDIRLTERIIDMMGIGHLAEKYADEISGGEYQLVQIARAFAQQPKVLLLDEPTSNLDIMNQHEICHTIINVVHNNDMAAIMVIHDINMAARHADKFIMMKDGGIFAIGGPEILTPENMEAVYGIKVYVADVHGIPVIVPADHDAEGHHHVDG